MTQKCKVTFGNLSSGHDMQRVFESKNEAFIWLNHQLVRTARLQSCDELFFRVESYFDKVVDNNFVLPF